MALSSPPTGILYRHLRNPSPAARTSSISNLCATLLSPRPLAQSKLVLYLALKRPSLSSIFIKTPNPHQPKFINNTVRSLFTGIVEEMGTVKQLGFDGSESFTMKIEAKVVLEDVHLGDSISVNGTCLTVTEFNTESSEFSVGLAPETLMGQA